MASVISFQRYQRYFVVGTIVGVTCVALREIIAILLPADTPSYYTLSVVLVYAFGMVGSFVLQRSFTFDAKKIDGGKGRFFKYVLVALIGAMLTAKLATLLRYELNLDALLGNFGATVAFVIAVCATSIVTFWLNAKLVFHSHT